MVLSTTASKEGMALYKHKTGTAGYVLFTRKTAVADNGRQNNNS
jgi:hypothetical protein